jgi:integrase
VIQKFSDLKKKFLSWAKEALSESSVNVYRHYLDRFEKRFGDPPLDKVKPAMLTRWAKTWHQCQAVKRLFIWAHTEAGLLDQNPLSHVKHPPKGHRRRIMSPLDTARLIRSVKPDLRLLLIGYRETMARPKELRVAKWENIKPDVASLKLRDALKTGRASLVYYEYKCRARRKDGERPRVIILSPRFCRLLLRLLDRSKSKRGYIFRTERRRPWTANGLRCRFRVIRRRLGIKRDSRGESIVPYTFRHTGATQAAAAGVRDRLLADMLGHVDAKTTARYQHLQVDHLRNAMTGIWDFDKKSKSNPNSK